ncbi:MAG: aldehyde dehydrogenase family protein [Pseudonocardiaceae bacterium]|nr:aldehyde dehydrogenase family protein [Pseudonocardiaceae bacterium]
MSADTEPTVVRPVDPTTGEPLGEIAANTVSQVDDAARLAERALGEGWRRDTRGRATTLRAWADLLRAHTDELVGSLVGETGKPVTEARAEVAASADALAYNAGMARYVGGRAGALPDGAQAHLVREPVGVVVFIVPWNWPVLLLLRDLAPALAAGVAALVKPAPQTTLVTRRVLDLGAEAGVPKDLLQLLVGGASVAQAAIAHPSVRAVAFTGSTTVGREIGVAAARGLKRSLLELGGKGASIVFADGDVEAATDASLAGSVITAGQMCMACTRLLVERSAYADVLDRLKERAPQLRVGHPAEESTQLGPLISQAQFDKVSGHLDVARADATVVVGGERTQPEGTSGWFLTPAVVTDVDVGSPTVQEDIFGPVLTVEPFDSDPDAVRLANATPYGLTASVWTGSVDRALRIGGALQAGTVWVNGHNRSYPEMPSGGYKDSGIGRTRGVEGIEEFTELKHMHFSLPDEPDPAGTPR